MICLCSYFVTCAAPDAATPTPPDCPVGNWRSPNVEQLQLKRQIKLGFEYSARAGGLVAVGEDADTAIIPDNMCKVRFSRIVWKESGMNHGRPCFEAEECPAEPEQPTAEQASLPMQTVGAIALGITIGVAAVLVAQRLRA